MIRLDSRAADFSDAFARLLSVKREISEDVDETVRGIIAGVVSGGDAALVDYSRRFDRLGEDFSEATLRFTDEEIEAAMAQCPPATLAALRLAAERIETYHRLQIPEDYIATDDLGVTSGWRWTALESVGLYVPGGTASYPSSVLMNAIPARVAGVPRVAMVVPTPEGRLNPLVLAAAQISGVTEIFRIGGAQAVAALAYGTQSVAPVAKIVGPGNAYVAAAKRRVFGQVGIDMIAGPSEVLILADGHANPDWIAADLLAQAEHDEAAQAILITTSDTLAEQVEQAVERALGTMSREKIARASWRDYGAIITVANFDEAVPLVDRLAPEHLEIETEDAEALSLKIRNAGAIFLGSHTPEAIGDYVGGPNHVLPTARSARFSSGLSVLDFMKRTSILRCDPAALRALGPAAIALGHSEGLDGHARSVAIRLNL
ncbi:histidinol dehydrogenase [Methylobacterium gnaphalii]|uniref:Histidinol dehydrogenase n=1 Tax=Methylobacterium gnaphalii TaxID=1010610 RepID=A0A512JRM3_9HYPH|nr:histidinol dehydrogenase [Methylobacterium gnaphalii]GEP12607.1 histidinol dehydrogenase [Methylobacterium gnaphalii]GJD71300.1 Histidinol dehydrogenase [Methylobacterium gnaphalii]GLS48043.1 histidinol dehydrogenase [Methylobacterium gnaphalii]